MSDLSEFLLARIAEDEEVARVAKPGPWWNRSLWREMDSPQEVSAAAEIVVPEADFTDGPHIARHNPARVLAECEAKRRIVRRLADLQGHFADTGRQMPDMHSAMLVDGTLADLALPYADHPDYDENWRP